MKKILLLIAVALAFVACNSDSYSDMSKKCKWMDSIFGFRLGMTKDEVIKSAKDSGYIIGCDDDICYDEDFMTWDYTNYYKDGETPKEWEMIPVTGVKVGECKLNNSIILNFYNGILSLINMKLTSDSDKVIDFIKCKYGNGVIGSKFSKGFSEFNYKDELYPMSRSYVLSEDSNLKYKYRRFYSNGNIFLVVDYGNGADIVFGIDTLSYKLKECILNNTNKSSYGSYTSSKPSGRGTMDKDDKEYWNSVNREKKLRDMGMKEAAELERKARIRYLEGGGYHSKDGGSQVHFQGSKEQEEQLKQMDEMGW